MSYTSFLFMLVFFLLTYVIYLLTNYKYRWIVLTISSFLFYFISSNGHILPMLAATAIIWFVGLLIQKTDDSSKSIPKDTDRQEKKRIKAKIKRKTGAVLSIGVVSCVLFILILKYGNFIRSIFVANAEPLPLLQPLGISFYTLQAISYLVDVKRKRVTACRNPLKLLLYLSFFLTVVEGPIVRFNEIENQFFAQEKKQITQKNFYYGAMLVLWGLFMKIIVSNRAALIAENVFNHYSDVGGITVVLGVLFYTVQLYFDFAGIMNVLRGLACLMGISLPENFKRPFFAKSINEFWQRWHITLGSWLRDYVFYSVSLSKPFQKISKLSRKKFNAYYSVIIPTSVALFFVWITNGLWHGSGTKYILYGMYYYVLMMLGIFMEPLFKKICEKVKLDRKSKLYSLFQVVRTFVIVNIGMLIFRADSISAAAAMVKSVFSIDKTMDFLHHPMATLYGNYNPGTYHDIVIILFGVAAAFLVGILREKNVNILEKIYKLNPVLRSALYFVFLILIVLIGAYGEDYQINQMIYAGF